MQYPPGSIWEHLSQVSIVRPIKKQIRCYAEIFKGLTFSFHCRFASDLNVAKASLSSGLSVMSP